MGVTHAKDKKRQIQLANEQWIRDAPRRNRANDEYYRKREQKRRARAKTQIKEAINSVGEIPFYLYGNPVLATVADLPWLNDWLRPRGYTLAYVKRHGYLVRYLE